MTITITKKNHTSLPLRRPLKSLERTFIDFLNGDRSTTIFNFLYSDDLAKNSGMSAWNEALGEKSAYYIFPNEVSLISRVAHEIADIIKYNSLLVELGTGSRKSVEQKTLPLIHALKPQRYIANDLSLQSVATARKVIKENIPGLDVEEYQSDFLDETSLLFGRGGGNVLMTGSSVSNIMAYDGQPPVNEVLSYLRKISSLLGQDGNLIITQDTNRDEQSLKIAYSSPELVSFRKELLYRLKAHMALESFNPSALKDELIWDKKAGLLASTFLNTKDQTIKVGETVVHLPAGRRLYVANSYKISAHYFLHISQLAGLAPVKTWMDAEGRVALHVLKINPDRTGGKPWTEQAFPAY